MIGNSIDQPTQWEFCVWVFCTNLGFCINRYEFREWAQSLLQHTKSGNGRENAACSQGNAKQNAHPKGQNRDEKRRQPYGVHKHSTCNAVLQEPAILTEAKLLNFCKSFLLPSLELEDTHVAQSFSSGFHALIIHFHHFVLVFLLAFLDGCVEQESEASCSKSCNPCHPHHFAQHP